MTLVVEIPGLPPVACNPNARVHWSAKAKAALSWGETFFYRLVDARNRSGDAEKWKGLDKATVRFTFLVPQNRKRRDLDNLIAANKAAVDAIVRAGVIVDDDIERVSLAFDARRDPNAPMTIVEITQ